MIYVLCTYVYNNNNNCFLKLSVACHNIWHDVNT